MLSDFRPVAIFLLLAPLIFVAYALLTPPFQTFDENQHLYRTWQIASLKLTAERRGSQSGGELPPGLAKATIREIGSVVPQGKRLVVVRPFSDIFRWNTPIGNEQSPIFYDFFGAAVYSPVGYVPQVVAVRIGEAFGLSVEWTLRVGRLFSCALCIGLIWWALTLLPFGRWTMTIIALLPPTAAGAASFGQDALVIGGGFLLTALGLKIAVDSRWSVRRFAIVAAAGIALTLSKFVYLPLIAVPVLPKPRSIALSRWLYPPLLIGFIAAILLFAWMRINSHSIVQFLPTLPTVSEQVFWIGSHPLDYLAVIARTYVRLVPVLWADLYRFGDSTVPIGLSAALAGAAALLLIMIHGDHQAVELTRARRLWMLVIVIVVAALIATAIFVTFTRPGAPYIPSIQGRYFLPVLPLALIALMRRGSAPSLPLMPAALTLALIAQAATLGTIIRTFYRF